MSKQEIEFIKINESAEDILPTIGDYSVLVVFENGSKETVHVEDFFGDITSGMNEDGSQRYSKWYIGHNPKLTHWAYIPDPILI